MTLSYVVTGGAQGIGRALVERLAREGHVVAVDIDAEPLRWTEAQAGVSAVAGDAADEAVGERAADAAEEAGTLSGWVNNAAVFRDTSLHAVRANDVLQLISLNLGLAVKGSAVAVRRFSIVGRAARSSTSHLIRRSDGCRARFPTPRPRPRSRG
jgi:NAD(P)-dependent dehydrogenase (short-subunit alcohol dehydrogenase family)